MLGLRLLLEVLSLQEKKNWVKLWVSGIRCYGRWLVIEGRGPGGDGGEYSRGLSVEDRRRCHWTPVLTRVDLRVTADIQQTDRKSIKPSRLNNKT